MSNPSFKVQLTVIMPEGTEEAKEWRYFQKLTEAISEYAKSTQTIVMTGLQGQPDIESMVKQFPNDADLGKEIRKTHNLNNELREASQSIKSV